MKMTIFARMEKGEPMSIILKGIEMLEDIDELRLIINGMSIAIEPTQAIQIPTPHGRIIDEDEIYEQPHCGECNDATLDAINNAPTILEAEEEE